MLPAGGSAQYYVEDLLGTSRVMTTSTGSLCYDADFYPYGGERTCTNSCPTANNYKFEGQERDSESGLDNFLARFNSSQFGRFLSIDPQQASGTAGDPRSWNAYAYTRNNPLNLVDPDGRIYCRAANETEKRSGIAEVCDVTDSEYDENAKAMTAKDTIT